MATSLPCRPLIPGSKDASCPALSPIPGSDTWRSAGKLSQAFQEEDAGGAPTCGLRPAGLRAFLFRDDYLSDDGLSLRTQGAGATGEMYKDNQGRMGGSRRTTQSGMWARTLPNQEHQGRVSKSCPTKGPGRRGTRSITQ